MPKTRVQKQEDVQKLTEKIGKAKAVVFTDYKGMTMSQLSDLRNRLRDISSEFSVTKNTILQRSVENSKLKADDSLFKGPIATLFAYDDEITPIKTLVKALKEFEIGQIKGGFLGEGSLTAQQITQLSSLPGKDELRGQVVGVLAAPLKGIMTVLSGNLRGLAVVINEIRKTKGGE